MKSFLIACGFLCLAAFTANAADPSPTPLPLEKTPLPPGPWVARMPAFSAWRILFSYASDKPSAKSATGGEKAKTSGGLPRLVAVTRTRPLYHVAYTQVSGQTSELWFDGSQSFLQTPDHPAPFLPSRNAGNGPDIPPYLDYSRVDFPNLEWVSPQTYLGSLQGENVTYLVFRQGSAGPMVYINADTRLPVRWQLNGDIRSFEYPTAPTDRLALPPAVSEASKVVHRMQEVTSHVPPRGS